MSNEEIKGEYMGLCNRTACQTPPATHYNYSTRKYYCSSCADIINAANRTDAMRLFGHDLCLEGLYVEQAPPPPVQSDSGVEANHQPMTKQQLIRLILDAAATGKIEDAEKAIDEYVKENKSN